MTSQPPAPVRRTTPATSSLYWGVVVYTTLGLVSGVFYREFTKAKHFTGETQLVVMHTHLLTLGTLLGLMLLILERTFALSSTKQWTPFVVTYHAGIVVTVGMMLVKGILQVDRSSAADSPAVSGIAGSGHILLTIAFVMLLMALKKRLDAPDAAVGTVESLRGSTDVVSGELAREVAARVAVAGVEVVEVRISHLAYAAEIAQAMLQRQQASAIVAARARIVEGAVGMVEMALARLEEQDVVSLDDERRAAMVSNLLVVLCGESKATPIVNTGTLYQ